MIFKVATEGLSLKFGPKLLLQHITCSFPSSRLNVLLGPNGAGKTLLLKCIAGLCPISSGNIRYDGEEISSLNNLQLARKRTWASSTSILSFSFLSRDLLEMSRFHLHNGFPGKSDQEAVDYALEFSGAKHLKDRVYNTLSSGERARVDIARAIASEAPIIILDEPFANFDIDAQLDMIRIFQQLTNIGKTLIFSHHDLHSLLDFDAYIHCIKSGRVIASGEKSSIFDESMIADLYGVHAIIIEDDDGRSFLKYLRK